jgi:hypothetical protein
LSSQKVQKFVRVALDTSEPLVEWVIAARWPGEIGSDIALSTLLQLARLEGLDECLVFAAGEGIAEVLLGRGRVDQLDIHNLTGPACLGYDDRIARDQYRRSRRAVDER